MSARTDDLTIGDDEILWRRVIPGWIKHETGSSRPVSVAFMDNLSNELSVFIASETTAEQVLQKFPADSLVAIRMGAFRALNYGIKREPEDGNDAHCVILPAPRRKDAKSFALQAEWVVKRWESPDL